jgi:hypothetical protein
VEVESTIGRVGIETVVHELDAADSTRGKYSTRHEAKSARVVILGNDLSYTPGGGV